MKNMFNVNDCSKVNKRLSTLLEHTSEYFLEHQGVLD